MRLRRLQYPGLLMLMIAAFVVQPLIARARAGMIEREQPCCCPDPATCPCHDHDDDAGSRDAELRRCGTDAVLVTAAVLLAVELPPRPPLPLAPAAVDAPLILIQLPPAERPSRPQTPPF